MAYYYAKVNINVLDDPDFGMLPESVQLLYLKLILLAKEQENKKSGTVGELPPINHMAFRLRLSGSVLESGLQQLSHTGLAKIALSDDDLLKESWVLTRYEEMQRPSGAATRMREYRKRKREEANGGDEKEENEVKKEKIEYR